MIADLPALSDLISYYGMLDQEQQTLVNTLLWLLALATVVQLTAKITAKKEADEDPFQVVISQPVGVAPQKYESKPAVKEGNPSIGVRQKEAGEIRKPMNWRPTHHKTNAVAELDYIESVKAENLLKLKATYGFVYVASERYWEAVELMRMRGIDMLGLFLPAKVENKDVKDPSVALALEVDAVVLTGNEKTQRICEEYGVPWAGIEYG